MYPNEDAPYFISGFTGAVSVIAIGICAYSTLPLWLMWEANRRKAKTGHAIPLQAMEDEDNAQISSAAHEKLHHIDAVAEKHAMAMEDERYATGMHDYKNPEVASVHIHHDGKV